MLVHTFAKLATGAALISFYSKQHLRTIKLKLDIVWGEAVPSATPPPPLPLSLLEVARRRSAGSCQSRFPSTDETTLILPPTKLSSWLFFLRRNIEWDFIDALAAVKLDIAVYQTFKERWRDVARQVLGLNRTIHVGAGLTEMKRLGVAALQLMLTFGNKVNLAMICAERLEMLLWWTKTALVGGMSAFLREK